MSSEIGNDAARAEIERMMHALGATTDLELAEILGVGPATVSAWRARGVSKKGRRAFASLRPDSLKLEGMSERRKLLGHAVLYEGLCLAIWLAPSLDAFGRRFGAANFTGTLRQYASLFTEIEVACAEEIEEKLREIGGANATLAFEELTKEPAEPLMERILQRARQWRFGDASS